MKKFNLPEQFTFYILFFLCLIGVFLYFAISLNQTYVSIFFRIFSSIADAALFTIPVILFKGRLRFLAIPYLLLIIVIVYINLLYFRNFEDLLPPSSYSLRAAGEPILFKSAMTSFKWADLCLILFFLIPIVYLLISPISKNGNFTYKRKWAVLAFLIIFIGAYTVTFAGGYRRIALSSENTKARNIISELYGDGFGLWKFYYDNHNFTSYIFVVVKNLHKTTLKLNPEEKIYIKNYLESKVGIEKKNHDVPTDENVSNLILIVVESLPFKVIEMEELNDIIPTLMSLKNESSIITLKSDVLTGYGRSADAQFIYNTGLLPLKNEAFVDNYSTKDYPSLAKALKIPSLEIIGEKQTLWFHGNTNRSYGFDKLVHSVAPNSLDQDSLIFEKASVELNGLQPPFFAFITTLSMHDPYVETNVTQNLDWNDLPFQDLRDKNYLERLNHFDRNLNRFLCSLKENGLYKNSVIFIMGDHEIRESTVTNKLHDNHIPVFIINHQNKRPLRKTITQLDIFPTILDLYNKDYIYKDIKYFGLGKSIYQDSVFYSPVQEDYSVSDMIIRGDL